MELLNGKKDSSKYFPYYLSRRSIRAIFDRYIGWFSGKSSDLHPDPPQSRSENLIRLGGGSEQVFQQVVQSFTEGKYQWVLELTDALLDHPGNVIVEQIKHYHSSALIQLASKETSANGRNWYLTKAYEMQGTIEIKPSLQLMTESIFKSPLKKLFGLLSIHFNYLKAGDVHQWILFHFKENNERFSIEIRNGIIDVQDQWPKDFSSLNIQMIVEVENERIWKEIIARLKTPIEAIEKELIIIKNADDQIDPEKILSFIEFLLIFAP